MMRVITPKGVLREVAEIVPVCEARYKFNGEQRRRVEIANNLYQSIPTGLVLRFQVHPFALGTGIDNGELFVGNLRTEQVADIQRELMSRGYFDFSTLVYQKAEWLKDTCYDQGSSMPYTSDFVRDLYSCFFPSVPLGQQFGNIFSQPACCGDIFCSGGCGTPNECVIESKEGDDEKCEA